MPSPRRPMRAISRRSITLGSEQELAVAVAAEDRGGEVAEDGPTERRHEAGDLLAHLGMDARVAHDAFLDLGATSLELRLDQRDQLGWRPRQRQGGRQNELERDEADI